ncbi:branched-chain amino acid ABC transporter permease [Paraburkholderia pallida]|uniref:Branched-chain amino acid ABC transporter permease n=1 Tax=Paraburkholderia pallida TaxID=2547399 RepID=A0A4P7DAX9_9BURK|nr:branched-chain amino acid ABC transporter permease [Paraburkholderia pallida]QBR04390.1 branched-chain amino acid ABC transporter permease [Paraburkholderia pallida]
MSAYQENSQDSSQVRGLYADTRNSRSLAASILAGWSPVLLLAIPLVVLAAAVEYAGNATLESIVTLALIRIVTVVGIYIFVGNSGIVSFGQIAFMAIAAYASAWQTCCEALKPMTMPGLPDFLLAGSMPLWLSGLTSVALAAAAAFVVGLILMRLSGLAASISTLAVLFIFNTVYSNWDSVTMGSASIVGLPEYVSAPVAVAGVVIALVIAFVHQRSRWGLMLRASREDEVAARAAGVSLYVSRLVAFTVSGAVMGMAGVLQAHFLGSISTDSFFLDLTFITLAMLIVGGTRSLAGAVVGTLVVQAITEVFRQLESGVNIGHAQIALPSGMQELVLAAAMLLILIFRRDGLLGGRELVLRLRPRSMRAPGP